MDANTPSFSNRSNAKRAPEAKLANGTVPAAEYELRTRYDDAPKLSGKLPLSRQRAWTRSKVSSMATTPLIRFFLSPATRATEREPRQVSPLSAPIGRPSIGSPLGNPGAGPPTRPCLRA
jgi:hypothetical protein